MGEFIGLVLTSLLGGALGTWAYTRARIRRAARAFEEGRETTFPGFVLGNLPYCRAAGGLLVLSSDALYHVADRGMPITRRDIPVERLTVVESRAATDRPQGHATRVDGARMP